MVRRIGIFGGTFDPPHVGHLVVGVNVAFELDLDEVHFVVANVPWQKVGARELTPPLDRLAMVEAAVDGVDGLVANDLEIRRGGDSYTIDTVHELEAGGEVEALVILGSDAARSVASWERAGELRERAKIVVVERPGSVEATPPPGWSWRSVESPLLEVSSTDIRRRFVDGRPLDFLLTRPVIEVIRSRGLYGSRADV